MKTYKNILERVVSKSVSGTMSGHTVGFDSNFKNKPLTANVKLKVSGGQSVSFQKGDLVSNLPGGVFIKFGPKNKTPEPKGYTNAGMGIIRSEVQLELLQGLIK